MKKKSITIKPKYRNLRQMEKEKRGMRMTWEEYVQWLVEDRCIDDKRSMDT